MTEFARLAGLSGLSDTALANYLGVRLDTIRHWMNGRRDAPPGVILELSNYCEWANARGAAQ